MYPEDQLEKDVPQQFQNLGFVVYQPLENLGTLGLLCVVYVAELALLGLLKVI